MFWVITIASILGAYLNAKGKIAGFYVWLPANVAWVIVDIHYNLWAQASLFVVYAGISVVGIYTWRKKGIK